MPDWVQNAIWWHIYPLGFVDAEPAAPSDGQTRHRLGRLTAWLDYAVELGASGLALGPIFASETHGYDTVDHLRLDPRLGDGTDLEAFFAAANDRGLRILLDGVFNHVGQGHPAFRAVLEQGPTAPTAPWFRLTWPESLTEPDHWHPGISPTYDTFEGHSQLVALNHDEPAVEEYVVTVMTHWLERGADGWRLDAAYAVPTQFWSRVLKRVRDAYPDAYVVGEVIHGDYAGFVHSSGAASVTQYELWKALWSSLNDHNLFELAWALNRHNDLLDTFVPLTFVGNHDVTRLASRLADDRFLAHALVVLLTVGGTPSIYAGDEQAFRGVKEDRAGGDDEVRPAFPSTPDQLAPHGWPIYRLHQELIGLRRRHAWLHRARFTQLHLANDQLSYRMEADGQELLIALNLADSPVDQPVPGARTVIAGSATLTAAGSPTAQALLPPAGWAVLET
jgi:cyclomaltodextrinase